MAVIATGNIAQALWPGVNKWFGSAYDEYPKEYEEIFEMMNSSKNYEKDVNIYGLKLAQQKPEGDAIPYTDYAQGPEQRYVHLVYGLGFILTRENIEDNQYSELAEQRSKKLAFSMNQTLENVGANVLNRAFNSSYTGFDGKELCATDHPLMRGGTFANELATPLDLSEAALESMCINIAKFQDDAGLRISVLPQKLIIPVDECFNAERILHSELQNDTANNALNALKQKGMFPGGYCVNHYLTDTDAFFIKTNCPDGMKGFMRRAPAIDKDTDFDTENVKFKCTARFVFGWTDPRGVYGSAGAA